MKIIQSYILVALLLLLPFASNAQVVVETKIDSLQILIGEQTGITLEVTCNANQHPIFPVLQPRQSLVKGVEVVSIPAMDTTMLNDGKRIQLTQRYIITSFDSALYALPPMDVVVDNKHYPSKGLALKVYTVPIDTLHLEQFYGVKPIDDAPFSWQDWKGVVYGSLSVILLIVLTFMMLVWLKQGNPIIRIIRRKNILPPHQVAMNEIQRIKEERNFTVDDSKEYYTQLTDTLRTYIQDRYGFRAMDMTSAEIIERLVQENDEEALNELRQLFETADLVKFAKYNTMINENDANLVTAINYVNQTKLEVDPNAKAEEVHYTPEEMRSIGMKWTLRIGIGLASLAIAIIVVLIIIRLFDLLS